MDPYAATEIGDVLPDTLEELCLVWDLLNPYTWVNELKLLKLVRNFLVDVVPYAAFEAHFHSDISHYGCGFVGEETGRCAGTVRAGGH